MILKMTPQKKNCQPSLTGDKQPSSKLNCLAFFCSVYNSDPVDDGEWIFVTEVTQTHWEKWEGHEEKMWVILQCTLFGTIMGHKMYNICAKSSNINLSNELYYIILAWAV